MLANMLSAIGCDLTCSASTKDEAIAMITGDEPVDIAFIDVNLDVRGGGIDVARAAAAQGMRIIIVTGDNHVPHGIAGHGLLFKPFSLENFEAVVAGALGPSQ